MATPYPRGPRRQPAAARRAARRRATTSRRASSPAEQLRRSRTPPSFGARPAEAGRHRHLHRGRVPPLRLELLRSASRSKASCPTESAPTSRAARRLAGPQRRAGQQPCMRTGGGTLVARRRQAAPGQAPRRRRGGLPQAARAGALEDHDAGRATRLAASSGKAGVTRRRLLRHARSSSTRSIEMLQARDRRADRRRLLLHPARLAALRRAHRRQHDPPAHDRRRRGPGRLPRRADRRRQRGARPRQGPRRHRRPAHVPRQQPQRLARRGQLRAGRREGVQPAQRRPLPAGVRHASAPAASSRCASCPRTRWSCSA